MEIVAYLCQFIKGHNKGHKWTANEEMCQTRSGRILSTGASVPVKLGCVTLLMMCLSTCKLPEFWTLGIFMEASSHRHDQLLAVSAPLWRMGSRAENSNLFIHGWFSLWSTIIQEAIQSCLIKTKDTPVTEEVKRFQKQCVKNQSQRKTDSLDSLYSLGNYRGFGSCVPGTVAETNTYFLLFQSVIILFFFLSILFYSSSVI